MTCLIVFKNRTVVKVDCNKSPMKGVSMTCLFCAKETKGFIKINKKKLDVCWDCYLTIPVKKLVNFIKEKLK